MRRFLILIVCLVGRVGYGQSVPVIDIDPGRDVARPPGPGQFEGFEEVGTSIDGVLGWQFSVIEPVRITHLGWYDQGGDGLSVDHRIGIWENPPGPSNESLVHESLIQGGIDAELFGPWRRIEVSSLLLEPATYVIAGTDGSLSTDVYQVVVDGTLPIDVRIVDFAPTSRADGIFAPPPTTLAVPGVIFGPTFFVEPIPEPSTIILLAFAIPLLAVRCYWF